MTSLEDHTGRPPVAPWLRGWVDDEAQTTLAWRRWLPRKADADEYFEAAPVELLETLERETTDVLDWLTKRVKQVARALDDAEARDPEGHGNATTLPRRDDVVAFILDEAARGWTLGELEELPKRQRDDLLRSLAGSTLVVDARLGGLDENGLLDPKADSARDVSDGQGSLLSFRVREVESLDGLGLDHDWRVEDTFTLRKNAAAEVVAWLVVETRPAAQATTADGRSTGRAQALDEHQACAARHARAMGARLGLRPEDVELLALAAVLHDEGKRPERWQRAFRVPVDQRPLGKSTSRPLQSVLAGYRHELGSLPYAERDPRVAALTPEDRDLVLHVIAAHHGLARPNLRTDGCDDAPPSALVERARGIALRFARLEQRWGPWGLAWWETLLRAADQQASRENDERGGIHG
jgi:CRISPR-associated endonuclease/helicase Cas3